ncbi:c-type cytochrome biogenesis protein CcmI [Teredinibacter haidensis]|uniref:c-type cytochrome biogenesis protein CcmI n=1 Tax=Teredinibacter haidensis TaxID=2731755 RepID=UPI000948BE8A|nr:c-type cytochrome biogenesis protein CcmI [Teredinibacter haidensis]
MEIAFWQGFLALSLLAMGFVVWPTIFIRREKKRELLTDAQGQVSEDVYHDHLRELEETHSRGEIESVDLNLLKRDLEKTMIEESDSSAARSEKPIVSNFKSRLPVMALALLLPLVALGIYGAVGAKPDWDIYQLAKERAQTVDMAERNQLSETLIESLQNRLQSKPGNSHNWHLLASVASELGDHDEAVRAYRRVLEIEPNAAQVMAELAQALFLRAGNTITPEVSENTQMALQLNPRMPTALGLAGIEAYQSGAYQTAIEHWSLAVSQLDPKSPSSVALSGGIARAQAALEKSGSTAASKKKKKNVVEGSTIKVSVSYDATVVNANPDDHVFVYARAWQGPKMPIAIRKLKVSDLPIRIELDNSSAMTDGMNLSSFPQVELVARITGSGSAIPQSGDWQVSEGPVIVAEQSETVTLKIVEQIP